MAAEHPYRELGGYFVLDLRASGVDLEVTGLTPYAPGPRWWLLHSPFEPPMRATRLVGAEQAMRRKVMELDAP